MFETRGRRPSPSSSPRRSSTADADKAEQVRIQGELADIYARTKSDVRHPRVADEGRRVDLLPPGGSGEDTFELRGSKTSSTKSTAGRPSTTGFSARTRRRSTPSSTGRRTLPEDDGRRYRPDRGPHRHLRSTRPSTASRPAGRRPKTFFNGLTKEQQRLSQEAYNVFQLQFDTLEDGVREKEQELADTLAESYRSNVDALQESFDKIKEDINPRWIEGRRHQLRQGAWPRSSAKLGELLFSVLSRLANVVGDILAHPIRFIQNLASGDRRGLRAVHQEHRRVPRGRLLRVAPRLGGSRHIAAREVRLPPALPPRHASPRAHLRKLPDDRGQGAGARRLSIFRRRARSSPRKGWRFVAPSARRVSRGCGSSSRPRCPASSRS